MKMVRAKKIKNKIRCVCFRDSIPSEFPIEIKIQIYCCNINDFAMHGIF